MKSVGYNTAGLQQGGSVAEYPQVGFTEAVLEEINEDQYKIDHEYWPEITAMQAPQMGGGPDSRGTPPGPPQAPRPKLPQKLFRILGRYAAASFECHYRRYTEAEKQTWGPALVNLTFQTVVNKIDWLERETPSASLTYHASLGHIRGAIRKALLAHFRSLPRPGVKIALSPPEAPAESSVAEPTVRREAKPEKAGKVEHAARRQQFMAPFLKKETLSSIATGSELTHSSLHRWHNGRSRLRPENQAKLAAYLHTDKEIPN